MYIRVLPPARRPSHEAGNMKLNEQWISQYFGEARTWKNSLEDNYTHELWT